MTNIATAMEQAVAVLQQALDADPAVAADLLTQLLPEDIDIDDIPLPEFDDVETIAPEDASDLLNLAGQFDEDAGEWAGDVDDPLADAENLDEEFFEDDAAFDINAAFGNDEGPADEDADEDGDTEEALDEDDEEEPAESAAAESAEAARKLPPPRPVTQGYPNPPCTLLVQQGDCVYSLAARYGHKVETLWDAAENEQLRKERKDSILLPGDPVFIPEIEVKTEAADTGQRHDFQVDSLLVKVSLRFLEDGEPRKEIEYTFTIDGKEHKGETDADGALEVWVHPTSREGELLLHDPAGEETYPVRVGDLNPSADATGVQARLNHLGYRCGGVDGDLGPRTLGALLAFQHDHDLELSGEVDDATIAKLEELHSA